MPHRNPRAPSDLWVTCCTLAACTAVVLAVLGQGRANDVGLVTIQALLLFGSLALAVVLAVRFLARPPSPPQPLPEPEPRPEPRSVVRALVVDSNADAALGLSLVLQADGMKTVTAMGVQSALEVARDSPPDVAVVHYRMPTTLHGEECCRQLRALGIPVVMISGICLSGPPPLDCEGWLIKGGDPAELAAAVRAVIATRPGG